MGNEAPPSTSAASGLERLRPRAAVVKDGDAASMVIEQSWADQAALILLVFWFVCGCVPVTVCGAIEGVGAHWQSMAFVFDVAWVYALSVAVVNRTRVSVRDDHVVCARGPLPWFGGWPRRTFARGDIANVVRHTRRMLADDRKTTSWSSTKLVVRTTAGRELKLVGGLTEAAAAAAEQAIEKALGIVDEPQLNTDVVEEPLAD